MNSQQENAPGRILLIAPANSYRLAPYLKAAQALNLEVEVVSEGEHSLITAVQRGLQIHFSRPDEALLRICESARLRPVRAVIGTDDQAVTLASAVSAALGLPHNPPQAAQLARRKDLARARLREAGVAVPDFRCLDLHKDVPTQLQALSYPLVLKPLALSGSRGVIRVDDAHQAGVAAERIARIIQAEPGLDQFEQSHILAEGFIEGPEFALEGMLHEGRLQVLALFDKPDPMNGPYFEESYYITPSRYPQVIQEAVADTVSQACAAYGLRTGPVHAELRWQRDRAVIMEVAARTIGGQCARLLQLGSGQSLEQWVIQQAMGKPPAEQNTEQAAGVLMIPIPRAGILQRVEGVARARRLDLIEDVEISVPEGYELEPLPEGASYLGFIFAKGPTADQVEAALRRAHEELNIVIRPILVQQPITVPR